MNRIDEDDEGENIINYHTHKKNRLISLHSIFPSSLCRSIISSNNVQFDETLDAKTFVLYLKV